MCIIVNVSVNVTLIFNGLLRACWMLVAMSVIIAIYVDPNAIASSCSTYIAIMTLIATNIQHVRNKPLQISVTSTDTLTTVQIITSSIKFQATATTNDTPTVVITSLLHQLLEDDNLKSFIKTQRESNPAGGQKILLHFNQPWTPLLS